MSNDELAAATWRKSSRSSGNGACVEVADLGAARIAVRDSKNPAGPVLAVSSSSWVAFTVAVRNGQLGQA